MHGRAGVAVDVGGLGHEHVHDGVDWGRARLAGHHFADGFFDEQEELHGLVGLVGIDSIVDESGKLGGGFGIAIAIAADCSYCC